MQFSTLWYLPSSFLRLSSHHIGMAKLDGVVCMWGRGWGVSKGG